MRDALDYQSPQSPKKRMFRVCAVEEMKTIAPAGDQIRCLKLRQFILHCLEGEKTQPSQFSDVKLLARIGKQELKNLRPDHRK